MAEGTSEQRQLRKVLRWHDGFIVAMSIPGALFAALGYTIGSVGAWGALALWAISSLIAVFMNWIYAELAAMFPDKPGGIALYAHEGWRQHFSLIGPIATFGYWFAWSSVLAIFGTTIGYLVQAEWFPGETWTFDAGAVDVGLPHLIGAGCVILGLGDQHAGDQAGRVDGACVDIPPAHPDRRLRDHRLPDRRLGQLAPPVELHRAVGRLEAGDRLALHHRLDRLRGRGRGELRARVPRHEARHLDGAEGRGPLHLRRVRPRAPGRGRHREHGGRRGQSRSGSGSPRSTRSWAARRTSWS